MEVNWMCFPLEGAVAFVGLRWSPLAIVKSENAACVCACLQAYVWGISFSQGVTALNVSLYDLMCADLCIYDVIQLGEGHWINTNTHTHHTLTEAFSSCVCH